MSWADRASEYHVFCSCGAAWHGKYTINNPVIGVHVRRDRHTLIDHKEYKARGFICRCATCVRERSAARAAARVRRDEQRAAKAK